MFSTASPSATYGPARHIGRAVRAVGVMACGLIVLQACSGSDAVAPIVPPIVLPANATPVTTVLGNATVGTALSTPVRLAVTDASGAAIAGTKVRWTTGNGGVLNVAESLTDSRGIASVQWTMGTVAGLQSLSAQVNGLPTVIFGANAVADRAAVVRFNTATVRVTLLGDTVRVSTTSTDKYGNAVSTPSTIVVESGADALGTIGSAFLARARGTAVLKATVDTASSRLTVYVDPATPTVTRIMPDTLVAGATLVVEGSGFAIVPEFIDLTIGNVKATITKVTAGRIEAMVPATYGCVATAPVAVKVTVSAAVGQLNVPLRTATRLSLAKGQSANILDADQVRCMELAAPAGAGNAKYVVAVINTSVTAAATSGFELRGVGTGALSGKTAAPVVKAPGAMMSSLSSATSALSNSRLASAMAQLASDERVEAQHDDYLDAQRALNARYGSPAPTWRAIAKVRAQSHVASARVAAQLGDTLTMKALYSSCATGRDIKARVVYAGAKAVIMEDMASSRAGMMDNQFQLIGDEYDRVQYDLVKANIGDPLIMNETMQGDGRITMLFTRYVNDSLPGLAGYVSACNFYPKGTFAASNEDEVFYARVPNANESPTEWRRSMRGTVIHESKHLVSFGTRFLFSSPFEESWLEESTGRIAEELYSRTFTNGGSWKGNNGYQTTVRCEIYQCDDRPLMMWKHFSVLHQYLRGVDTLTPIGAAANGDFTFYASGWSLVRWAADHYAGNEATWLKDLVRGGQLTGLSNLSAKTGRPAGEMLADWALATAVDDLPGFTPARSQLTMPTWNTANVFAGLADTYPGSFVASPLKARAMTFGSFTLPVPKLRAFSSSYFSFEGGQSGSQMIELRGESGGAVPPSSLRVAVVRVE